jgi:biopolymer transport protein ExbD
MRFRRNSEDNDMPAIDLVPMLTVMLGVLSYFVVTSASISNEASLQVNLPPEASSSAPEANPEPFIVQMDASGQPLLNSEPISREALASRVQAYLAQNQNSTVYLIPSRDLPYEQVMQFLGSMRDVGGDRISLALEDIPADMPAAAPANANSATDPTDTE